VVVCGMVQDEIGYFECNGSACDADEECKEDAFVVVHDDGMEDFVRSDGGCDQDEHEEVEEKELELLDVAVDEVEGV